MLEAKQHYLIFDCWVAVFEESEAAAAALFKYRYTGYPFKGRLPPPHGGHTAYQSYGEDRTCVTAAWWTSTHWTEESGSKVDAISPNTPFFVAERTDTLALILSEEHNGWICADALIENGYDIRKLGDSDSWQKTVEECDAYWNDLHDFHTRRLPRRERRALKFGRAQK